MKKLLLSIALLSTAIFSIAQQRTEAEAAEIAKAFMQNNGYSFNITKSMAPAKMRAKKAGEIVPYYIFNDTQKGGFVIVGGQEAMSDILAYSNEDCFDPTNIPPAAAGWLEVYTQCAITAADNPEKSMAEKKAAAKAFAKSNFSQRQNVEPLLGEIKYNQGAPYNIACPMLETSYGGKSHALTGCTQTAQAMIMRYWKYPNRPRGYKAYTSYRPDVSGQYVNLEVNFDDAEPYDWDNILPRYEGHSYTEEQANAIAILMYHCGVANDAEYGISITNAAISHQGFVDYFGYASDIVIDSYTYYKNKANGDNEFRASLINEISQRRPILAGGWNAEYNGGHYYVIDGYDINNLLHFNLGWNGSSNGYYEVVPVPQVPYGYNMYVCRHIHPEGRLTPTSPVRKVVIEAGLGQFNEQSANIISTLKSLNSDSKYGESLICITTANNEKEAVNYLEGLNSIQGILIDRNDTVTSKISTSSVEQVYKKRINTDAPANIDIDAVFTAEDSIKVSVASLFSNSIENANYRYQFVYTEDNVKIDGTTYNSIARGAYPNSKGYENSVPAKVEEDKEYIFEQVIPIPTTINDINATTLIALMIDATSGEVVNANTLDLKQINTWRQKQMPSFYNNGKLLASGTTIETSSYDDKNKRMYFPVKLNNPLHEPMEIELIAEDIDLGENVEVQLGENAGETAVVYNLAPLAVDSTMILYLNINNEYISSESTIKLSVIYNDKVVTEQIVDFKFIETIEGVNSFTVRTAGTLKELVPETSIDTITTITIAGFLSGRDMAFLRENITADIIDLSRANIVNSSEIYYGTNTTEKDIVGTRMFFKVNASKITLPETVTKINTYAFYNSTNLKNVIIGENVTFIGNYAFKGCPLECVICKRETPATISTNVFDNGIPANATLVVPTEAAVEIYKNTNIWKKFGNIISYDRYITNISTIAENAAISVKDGRIIVSDDTEVAIYTIAGKLMAKGNNGEYTLPTGTYIVKIGNKAIKVSISKHL